MLPGILSISCNVSAHSPCFGFATFESFFFRAPIGRGIKFRVLDSTSPTPPS